MRELVRLGDDLLRLAVQLGDAREARAGDRLVGGDDQRFEAGLLVQRTKDRHRGHRRAVRVGDDALGAVRDRVRVDLGDDQRDLGVLAPGRRVVDHDRALGRDLLGERLGGASTGGEDDDVEARVVGRRGVLHRHTVDDRPGRAGRGEQAQLVDREVPLDEDLAHDRADLTGGSDDSDLHRVFLRTYTNRTAGVPLHDASVPGRLVQSIVRGAGRHIHPCLTVRTFRPVPAS